MLIRIALPLSLPALAVLATLQFTWIWNDFLWPLVLMKTESKMTIQMGIMPVSYTHLTLPTILRV